TSSCCDSSLDMRPPALPLRQDAGPKSSIHCYPMYSKYQHHRVFLHNQTQSQNRTLSRRIEIRRSVVYNLLSMMRFRLPAALVALTLTGPAAEVERSVPPLLASNCSECHSDRVKTSGFSVSSLDALIAGGAKYGRAIIEGHPEKSPLVRIIKGDLKPR